MLDIISKVHDESRQGEAFVPFKDDVNEYQKKFYIESYGCQMNFSDSEIVASILNNEGFGATRNYEEADLVLLNTCSIREKAEQTVRKRLSDLRESELRVSAEAHLQTKQNRDNPKDDRCGFGCGLAGDEGRIL